VLSIYVFVEDLLSADVWIYSEPIVNLVFAPLQEGNKSQNTGIPYSSNTFIGKIKYSDLVSFLASVTPLLICLGNQATQSE